MGIEKKASLICVVVLAVLFGIGLANREERPSNETAQVLRQRDPQQRSAAEIVISEPQKTPEPKPHDEPTYELVEVKAGDSYSKIAQRRLGSAALHGLLARANPDKPPRRLRPGQKIRVPIGASLLAEKLSAKRGEKPVASREETDSETPRTYEVKRGDSLSGISQKFYRRASRWQEIWVANKKVLPDPHRLKPGLVLTIP